MPKPVMAAALFFNGSFMLVGGMQIAFRRPVAIRETFTIGISIILAIGSAVYPEFFKELPAWTHPITNSPIAIATTAAVTLNFVFLFGRLRLSSMNLQISDQPANEKHISEFIAQKAKEWKIAAADSRRVQLTVEDLIDQIVTANVNEGPIEITIAYDDFDVVVLHSYEGSLVQTGSPKFSREPTEEQAFISGLSGYLNDVAADRVEPSVQDGKCQIKLTFKT